jgi:hypothetical protein
LEFAMDRIDLPDELRRMTDETVVPTDLQAVLDDVSRGRRRRGGLVATCAAAAVAVVVGVAGVAAFNSDQGSPGVVASSGLTAAPTSTVPSPAANPASLCNNPSTTISFRGSWDGPSDGAATAEDAANKWVGPQETATVIPSSLSGKAVARLGVPSGPVREVLVLVKSSGKWYVSKTIGCGRHESGICTSTLAMNGNSYEPAAPAQAGSGTGVGRFVGQAEVDGCFMRKGSGPVLLISTVSPVTAYQANEEPPAHALVIAQDEAAPALYIAK